METVLKAAVFVNEEDNQVRTAHKILGYNPIQKSFAALKHVIRANDPWLQSIMVAEHGFFISEGSPVPEGIPLAGSSSSHQAMEDEGDLGLFEEGFSVFDQADPSEDPSGDLGDPDLSEAELDTKFLISVQVINDFFLSKKKKKKKKERKKEKLLMTPIKTPKKVFKSKTN